MNGDFEELEDLEASYEELEDPFLGGFIKRIPWGRLARTAGQSILSAVGQAIGEEGEEEAFDFEEFDGYEEFGDGVIQGSAVSSNHRVRRQFFIAITVRFAPTPRSPLKSRASSPNVTPCRTGIVT